MFKSGCTIACLKKVRTARELRDVLTTVKIRQPTVIKTGLNKINNYTHHKEQDIKGILRGQ